MYLAFVLPFPPNRTIFSHHWVNVPLGQRQTIKNLGIMYMCKSIHFECRKQLYISVVLLPRILIAEMYMVEELIRHNMKQLSNAWLLSFSLVIVHAEIMCFNVTKLR